MEVFINGLTQTLNADETDKYWMARALKLAQHAENLGEVPVGAILVLENEMIAEAWNQPIQACDPTAHAEIVALRQGALQLQNYRLVNTTLYVTLEPCLMCMGALMHSRVKRVVFGAFDPKAGGCTSVEGAFMKGRAFHNQLLIEGGLLAEASAALLQNFFRIRR